MGWADGPQLILLVGMAFLLAGMLLQLVWRVPVWGSVTLAVGALSIGGAVWWLGRGQKITVYRPIPWRLRDSVVCVGALITGLCFLVAVPGLDRSTVLYYPYPALHWPDLDLVIGMSTWGLLPPAFVLLRGLARAARDTRPDTDG
jgi:hypothetical protein